MFYLYRILLFGGFIVFNLLCWYYFLCFIDWLGKFIWKFKNW